MSLAVAIQMDPIEAVDIDADSTFVMALEAQRRGHALWHYLPQHLMLRDGRLYARARRLEVRRVRGNHYTLAGFETLDLSTMDIVLMRQDPPFDMAYITATHLLEHIQPHTLVLNDPAHVRNAPEKLFVTHFKDVMPPTLIASDKPSIEEFRAEHGDIVLKPLFGNGGSDVFHLTAGDENFNALIELFTRLYREPIIVQRYIPEVRQGDKRIVLVDGKPLGAVSRVPKAGEARANLHVGAVAVKAELSARDKEICSAIGPTLKEHGLVFVGIDVIGNYLTEINVTSPTGIQEINRLDGVALEIALWDAIEARFEARHDLRPM
ncbi:MAG: glutathione synthase [Alphaproteobacteria bacterium]